MASPHAAYAARRSAGGRGARAPPVSAASAARRRAARGSGAGRPASVESDDDDDGGGGEALSDGAASPTRRVTEKIARFGARRAAAEAARARMSASRSLILDINIAGSEEKCGAQDS